MSHRILIPLAHPSVLRIDVQEFFMRQRVEAPGKLQVDTTRLQTVQMRDIIQP